MKNNSIVYQRQKPLMVDYQKEPKKAWITDMAIIESENLDDPFHNTVSINEELKVPFRAGVHRAVGGLHDAPNPGDLLCASLAVCFESTLRMVANRLNVELVRTKVRATAEVDVRGTLMIDPSVPVAFQCMGLDVTVETSHFDKVEKVQQLLKATEHCCIVYQTLKTNLPIHLNLKIVNPKSLVEKE